MKKIMIIACVMLLMGVTGTVTTAWGSNLFSQERLIETKEVQGDFSKINIDTSLVDVNIVPSKSHKIEVNLYGKESKKNLENYKLTIDENGGNLHIKVNNNKILYFTEAPYNPINIEVKLPEKVYESIDATTETGDLKFYKINANAINSNTYSGDVIMEKTNSGDFNVKCDIRARTTTGDIDIQTSKIGCDTYVESSSGDVLVKTKEKPTSLAINYKGNSGDCVVNLENVIYEEKSENAIIGTIGDGEYFLKVITSSGDFIMN